MGKKNKEPTWHCHVHFVLHQLEDRTPVVASPAVPSSRTRMLVALAGMVTSVNVWDSDEHFKQQKVWVCLSQLQNQKKLFEVKSEPKGLQLWIPMIPGIPSSKRPGGHRQFHDEFQGCCAVSKVKVVGDLKLRPRVTLVAGRRAKCRIYSLIPSYNPEVERQYLNHCFNTNDKSSY